MAPAAPQTVLMQPTLCKMLKGHKGTITGLCFEPNNKQIVTSSADHSLIVWNLIERKEAYRFSGHADEVTDVCYSPDGRLIASSSVDKTVRIWNGSLRTNSKDYKAHLNVVRSVHFSPDSHHIVTASDDKSVKVWNASRRKYEACFTGHYSWVRCARFSSDGRIIASCADDKTTKLFDRSTGLCCTTFKELSGGPSKVAFHPGDKCLAVGLSNGSVRVYDPRNNRQPIQQYQCHENCVSSVSFHSSGNYLLTASSDSSMKVIDLVEARPVYTMEGHTGPITAATFSAEGSMLASGGSDKKLLLWNVNRVTINGRSISPGARMSRIPNGDEINCIGEAQPSANNNFENNQDCQSEPSAKGTAVMDLLQRVHESLSTLTHTVTHLEERLERLEVISSRNSVCRCTH